MEKFRPSPIVEVVRTLNELCRRLSGRDPEKVRQMAIETLQTAEVTHDKELHKAQSRRTHHRRKKCKSHRSLGPKTGTSVLRALNQTVELKEKQAVVQPEPNQITLPPQAHRNRYILALMSEMRNALSAVVGMMMMLHDCRQREARKTYELVTQNEDSLKTDSKFFEKRTEIKTKLNDRFRPTNSFKFEPSGKEIETVPLSEAEADENYAFQELCASLLGKPFFTNRFDPSKPIPKLTSNALSFDEEEEVEHRRIRALVSPQSFGNLMESQGCSNMKKKAKGPVLSVFVSGNGNNGRHNLPEPTEADVQEDIDAVVNSVFDSAKFRCQLKYPDLEVVVDGAAMSAPFAAISAANRRFELPSVARFIQVFATQNDRREIVSNLVLRDTEVSNGKTWQSELKLEGRQIVTLTVEPAMDNSGKLASSTLFVAYEPQLSIFEKLADGLKGLGARALELWPSLMIRPVFAFVIVCLALGPFFTIKIFSPKAVFLLTLALTLFLIVAGVIKPAWKLIRLQQVAIDGFMALMLVALLFFGILPIGSLRQSTIASLTKSSVIENGLPTAFRHTEGLPLAPPAHEMDLQSYAISHDWTRENSLSSGNDATDSIYWRDIVMLPTYRSSNPFRWKTDPRTPKRASIESTPNESAVRVRGRLTGAQAEVKRRLDRNFVLRDVFHVEVLVDTSQIITLIRNNSSNVTQLSLPAAKTQAKIIEVLDPTPHAEGTTVNNRLMGEPQPSTAELQAFAHATSSTMVVSTKQTPALVVFDSPMQLARLNKGDVLNANFKPISLTPKDPREAVLECTATGVVQDIVRTGGTNVEIRVGLLLTWVRGGNTVNSQLDLVLRDCAQEKENSHYGVLAAPQIQTTEVAKLDARLRKP